MSMAFGGLLSPTPILRAHQRKTNTTMAAASISTPPSAPQEDMHPAMTQQIDSLQPLKKVYMLWGVIGESL
jgi:hypothetical protein